MSENINILAEGLAFPEGPVWMNDGSVLVAELRTSQVSRVAPDGTVSVVARCGGSPNGLAIGPDGALYVCNNGGSHYVPGHTQSQGPALDYTGGYIQRIDLATGAVQSLYTECDGHKLSAPNDLVFDTHGGFYFTDFGKKFARHRDHGGIYYALADGSKVIPVAYPVMAANGIGLSPGGETLYVAETETARVWAFDVIEPGKVAKLPFPSPHGGRLLYGAPGFRRYDSLGVDSEGNVCVATLVTGEVGVISPDGELLRMLQMPDIYVTNICFGGPDMRTAFVTLSETGRLASFPWPVSGLKLNFNA